MLPCRFFFYKVFVEIIAVGQRLDSRRGNIIHHAFASKAGLARAPLVNSVIQQGARDLGRIGIISALLNLCFQHRNSFTANVWNLLQLRCQLLHLGEF